MFPSPRIVPPQYTPSPRFLQVLLQKNAFSFLLALRPLSGARAAPVFLTEPPRPRALSVPELPLFFKKFIEKYDEFKAASRICLNIFRLPPAKYRKTPPGAALFSLYPPNFQNASSFFLTCIFPCDKLYYSRL